MFNVILHYYNSDLKIIVKTDTSDYVSEGILSQYNENDVLYLIAYFFKKHNSAECNYEIYNKELIVIVHTFKEWCSELKDSILSESCRASHADIVTRISIVESHMGERVAYYIEARTSRARLTALGPIRC